jgi:hypothetical protein
VGALTKNHLEHRDIAVEGFLEMLRIDLRDKVQNSLAKCCGSVFEMSPLITRDISQLSADQIIENQITG